MKQVLQYYAVNEKPMNNDILDLNACQVQGVKKVS